MHLGGPNPGNPDHRYPPIDIGNAKYALMHYGAISIGVYATDAMMQQVTSADSWQNDNAAYYYKGSGISNHAVDIIGWNDSYPKENFATTPPDDGAWIVRNSWGTNWGDEGYFYISYCSDGTDGGNAYTVEDADNYDNIRQYDPLGPSSVLGFSGETAWFANVFQAEGGERIRAVSFYSNGASADYEVSVYTDLPAEPVSPGEGILAGTTVGSLDHSGYVTIPLDQTISADAEEHFSTVVKLTTHGFDYPVPLETPVPEYSSNATAGDYQSYVSSNDVEWVSLRNTAEWINANVCLKAFTDNIEHTIEASAGDGGDITPSGEVAVVRSADQAFSVSADEGYEIDTISVDNEALPDAAGERSYTYTFRNVGEDHSIAASFRTRQLIIDAEAGTGGSIAPEGEVSVDYGDDQRFNISADQGYRIATLAVDTDPVSGAVGETAYSYTFEDVSEDHTIEAAFVGTTTPTPTEPPTPTATPTPAPVPEPQDIDQADVTPDSGTTDVEVTPLPEEEKSEIRQQAHQMVTEGVAESVDEIRTTRLSARLASGSDWAGFSIGNSGNSLDNQSVAKTAVLVYNTRTEKWDRFDPGDVNESLQVTRDSGTGKVSVKVKDQGDYDRDGAVGSVEMDMAIVTYQASTSGSSGGGCNIGPSAAALFLLLTPGLLFLRR